MSGRPPARTSESLAFSAGSDNAWTVDFAESKVFDSPAISGDTAGTAAGTDSPTVARSHALGKSFRRLCDSCLRVCKPDAHHPDYTRPLTVEWLCRKCHAAADQIRAAKDTFQAAAAQPQQAQRDLHVSDMGTQQRGPATSVGRRRHMRVTVGHSASERKVTMFPLAFPYYTETPAGKAMRIAVSEALLDAHLSRKEAALLMDVKESHLSRQLAGEPGTHLSLWRLASLPDAFWGAFIARIAHQHGAMVLSPELVTLLRGAATLKRVVLKAAMTPQKVERAV